MANQQGLQGLRVLEVGDFISAAYCARLLGDLGAEVIKVESPGLGDVARSHGPFPDHESEPKTSGLFLFLNTGKKSVTLDLGRPEGMAIFLRLMPAVDVVVHNLLPQEIGRLGITYDRLRGIHPALVMTSITVFGHEGPYSRYKGYALTAAAAGGGAHRIGHPARYPLAMPCDRADYWGGLHGAAGTTLALVARLATGRGQHVDISSAESLNNYVNGHDTITYVDTGFVPRRRGHRVALLYPYTTLPCKDGYFGLIIANQHHWERFVELMGSPEWSKLPRYQDRLAMGSEYPDEVDALIVPWLRRYTKKELWAMCRERGIPFHPLQTIDEVMEWEQLKARAYWQRVRDDAGRDWTLPGPLFKMSRTPARAFRPAPRLGEHTRDVLQGLLGMSGDDVEQLSTAGVI